MSALELRSFENAPAQKGSAICEPLLPIATLSVSQVPHTYYGLGAADTDVLIVQPAALHHHRSAGLQAIAESESKRIVDDILSSHRDGQNIVQIEHNGFISSKAEGSEMSQGIRDAIKSSMYLDDLDPLFLQQRNDSIDGAPQRVKMDTDDRMAANNTVPQTGYHTSGAQGYQMPEYKSIYATGDPSAEGYKVSEYKSIYDN